MAAITRIYTVSSRKGGAPRLVRATHPAHALRHVADGEYTVAVASQDDIVTAYESGTKVENLTAEQQQLTPEE
jgi:hypothetical protein